MIPPLLQPVKTCLLFIILISLCSTYSITYARGYKDDKFFDDYQDSTAKAASENAQKAAQNATKAAQAADKEVKGFFQNIGSAFQFKKNSRAKEKQRIISIVDAMGITDSIARINDTLKNLIGQLSVSEKKDFDSLISLILKSSNSAPNKNNPANPSSEPLPDLSPDSASSAELISANIQALTDKLTSILASKNNNLTEDTEKAKQLLILRKIASGNDTVTTSADGKLFKRSKLTIRKKTNVYGFYNNFYNFTPQPLPFNLLSGVIFDALLLQGSSGNVHTADVQQTYQVGQFAKAAGCGIYYTIFGDNYISAFLRNPRNTQLFIGSILHLLKTNRINGLNINFKQLQNGDQYFFQEFLRHLSDSVKISYPNFQFFVTVPPTDLSNIYNVKAIDSLTDKFIIDFSVNYSPTQAPLFALDGKESTNLTTSISFYLNQKISPSKLIVNIPYKGVRWALLNNTNKDSLIQYISYSDIRTKYDWPLNYDDATNSAYMDSLNKKDNVTTRIWFDDEYTLSKKYDYLIASGVNGVGIDYLGYDSKYGELTDILAYKALQIDTTALADSLWGPRPLTLKERLLRKYYLYSYILNNPCEVCFENVASDSQRWDSIPVYLRDLRIDSIIDARNSIIAANNLGLPEGKKIPLLTSFSYVNQELNQLLVVLTLIFLILSLGAALFYVYKIRTDGDDWTYKKLTAGVLTGLVLLFSFSFITYIFTNDYLPYFGVSSVQVERVAVYEKPDSSATVPLSALLTKTAEHSKECKPDEDCINIPLQTLFLVVIFGSLIGLIITRYFVAPLLKRKDVP